MLGGCTFPPYCCHHDHHCGCMYLPSPSLSKRAKASLNSAVCSSVSWSAILILIPDIWKIFWICKTHNAQMQNILVKMTLFWPLKAESYLSTLVAGMIYIGSFVKECAPAAAYQTNINARPACICACLVLFCPLKTESHCANGHGVPLWQNNIYWLFFSKSEKEGAVCWFGLRFHFICGGSLTRFKPAQDVEQAMPFQSLQPYWTSDRCWAGRPWGMGWGWAKRKILRCTPLRFIDTNQ